MAFDWVKAADLATSGLELAQAFGGRGESRESKSARKSAKQARKLAAAAADPTSARFQNLSGLYDEENRRDLVSAIDRIMRVSARARARGDTQFGVNPERRDESRYRALAQAFMNSKEAARREARDTLLAASRGITGSAGAIPVGAGERRAGENFDLRTTGLTSVVPFAENLAKFIGGLNIGGKGGAPGAHPLSGGAPVSGGMPSFGSSGVGSGVGGAPGALRTQYTSYP